MRPWVVGALIPFLTGFIEAGVCDVVLGNRIRTRREALANGMPAWKYVAKRVLTFVEKVVLGQKLGECCLGVKQGPIFIQRH